MFSTKKKKKEEFNWRILLIVSLSSIVTGIYRDGFATLFPFIQQDFQLTRTQLGLHSTLFFFAITFSVIFAGRLVDIKGTKWSMGIGLFLMGLLISLHSIVTNFVLLLVLAAFTGVAVSMNLPSASKGIVEWFPRKWRSTALGIRSTAFPFGGMIGSILLPFFAHLIGWQKTMLFPGMLSLMCAGLIYFFYHNKNKEDIDKPKKGSRKDILFRETIRKLIKNKDLVSVFIFGIFLAATNGAIVAHFTLYLYLDYGLTKSVAGLGFAIVQLGSISGRLGWGFICDRLLEADKRKTFLYLGVSFAFLMFVIAIFLKNIHLPISIIMLLAFLIGWSGRGWQGIYISYITEAVEEENIGIAVGFSSIFTRPSMMLAPPIFGYIADITGTYRLSWFLLGLMMFISSVAQYLIYIKTPLNGEKV